MIAANNHHHPDAAHGAEQPAAPVTKLDHALAMAARGFAVFPLQEGGKVPLPGSNGHRNATTDPDAIRLAWTCPLTGAVLPYNIGATPADGRHLVVDLDVKDGRDGVAAYEAMGGELEGLVVATPSGGRHVYYKTLEPLATGAGRLAPGIDTRGADGYAVAPGSVVDGRAYEIIEDSGIRPLPAFVAAIVGTRAARPAPATTYAIEPDQPRNIARFVEACRRTPGAVAGNWHDASRDLACEAVRCAVTVDTATELMREHWVPRGSSFEDDGRADRWPADVAGSYAWAMSQGEHGVHSVDAQLLAFSGVDIVPPPPEPTAPAAPEGPPGAARWRRVCSTSLVGQPVPPREWLVDQWLAPGHVTVFFGEGGIGKSILMQQLMLACATGREWLSLKTTACPTFGLLCEDSEGEIHRRQIGLCGLMGVDLAETGAMSWISGVDTDNELVVCDRSGRMETTERFLALEQEVVETGARLVVIDTGACTFGGDENVRRQVTYFLRVALGRIAKATNAAVLLSLHPSRSGINRGDPDGGSTGWTGSARARWTLSKVRGELGAVDPAERVLGLPKSNYGLDGLELKIRRIREGFVPVVPLTMAEARARDIQAEDVFLKLLNRWNLQGRNVSPHPQASTYAAKVLSQEPDRAGLLRSDFEGAMYRLFNQGRLMVEAWGPPSKPRQRVVPTPGR